MDFLKQLFQDAIIPSRESKPKALYRDELNKKKKAHFESKALLRRDYTGKNSEAGNEREEISRGVAAVVDEEESGIQVKILMKKEEAVRLLSKCKDGGVLEFKDVADELVQIPNNRVLVQIPSDRVDAVSSKKDR